eukprot:7289647-Prymnesium_polylepis.2
MPHPLACPEIVSHGEQPHPSCGMWKCPKWGGLPRDTLSACGRAISKLSCSRIDRVATCWAHSQAKARAAAVWRQPMHKISGIR